MGGRRRLLGREVRFYLGLRYVRKFEEGLETLRLGLKGDQIETLPAEVDQTELREVDLDFFLVDLDLVEHVLDLGEHDVVADERDLAELGLFMELSLLEDVIQILETVDG